MHKLLIVIENAGSSYSADSPDLPGCIATGASREETEKNMFEAIQLHLEGMREDNLPISESSSFAEALVVPALSIGSEILAFIRKHGVMSVVLAGGIIGCPHEEGVDDPEGEVCPACPYWADRDGWTGERLPRS